MHSNEPVQFVNILLSHEDRAMEHNSVTTSDSRRSLIITDPGCTVDRKVVVIVKLDDAKPISREATLDTCDFWFYYGT